MGASRPRSNWSTSRRRCRSGAAGCRPRVMRRSRGRSCRTRPGWPGPVRRSASSSVGRRRRPAQASSAGGWSASDSTTASRVAALQEGEPTGAEVVGQGAEGLGAERDLGVERPRARGVERGGDLRRAAPGWHRVAARRRDRADGGLVDAAHAVDGHVLDQQVLFHQGRSGVEVGRPVTVGRACQPSSGRRGADRRGRRSGVRRW